MTKAKRKYADHELNLPQRWFTGKQWNDGTATKQFKEDYKMAIAKKEGESPKKKITSEPDWGGTCEVCGASPILPETGMCGPCTFGEADTAGGNW